jgi:hypothetical protein
MAAKEDTLIDPVAFEAEALKAIGMPKEIVMRCVKLKGVRILVVVECYSVLFVEEFYF